MEVDLHIHSHHSADSRARPADIVARAVELGLGAIAITDHDSWLGAREATRLADGRILVIPGAEIKTDKGDVLALFVDEELRSREFAVVIEEIRSRAGVSIIPHPADSPRITELELRLADGLETFNSTCTKRSNARAAALAERHSKPGFASSDAHMVVEIGNGRTTIEDCESLEELRHNILKNPVISLRMGSNPLLHRMNEAYNFVTKGIWKKRESRAH
ncbi:MAG: PHP-associated domain-containing protein [Thermoplasmata archaeon]